MPIRISRSYTCTCTCTCTIENDMFARLHVRVSMCVHTCVCVWGGVHTENWGDPGDKAKIQGKDFLVYMYMYVSQVLLSGWRESWRKRGMYILPWLITKRAEEQRTKDWPKREPSALPGHSYDTGITIAPFKALDWTKEKASLCSEGGRGEKW